MSGPPPPPPPSTILKGSYVRPVAPPPAPKSAFEQALAAAAKRREESNVPPVVDTTPPPPPPPGPVVVSSSSRTDSFPPPPPPAPASQPSTGAYKRSITPPHDSKTAFASALAAVAKEKEEPSDVPTSGPPPPPPPPQQEVVASSLPPPPPPPLASTSQQPTGAYKRSVTPPPPEPKSPFASALSAVAKRREESSSSSSLPPPPPPSSSSPPKKTAAPKSAFASALSAVANRNQESVGNASPPPPPPPSGFAAPTPPPPPPPSSSSSTSTLDESAPPLPSVSPPPKAKSSGAFVMEPCNDQLPVLECVVMSVQPKVGKSSLLACFRDGAPGDPNPGCSVGSVECTNGGTQFRFIEMESLQVPMEQSLSIRCILLLFNMVDDRRHDDVQNAVAELQQQFPFVPVVLVGTFADMAGQLLAGTFKVGELECQPLSLRALMAQRTKNVQAIFQNVVTQALKEDAKLTKVQADCQALWQQLWKQPELAAVANSYDERNITFATLNSLPNRPKTWPAKAPRPRPAQVPALPTELWTLEVAPKKLNLVLYREGILRHMVPVARSVQHQVRWRTGVLAEMEHDNLRRMEQGLSMSLSHDLMLTMKLQLDPNCFFLHPSSESLLAHCSGVKSMLQSCHAAMTKMIMHSFVAQGIAKQQNLVITFKMGSKLAVIWEEAKGTLLVHFDASTFAEPDLTQALLSRFRARMNIGLKEALDNTKSERQGHDFQIDIGVEHLSSTSDFKSLTDDQQYGMVVRIAGGQLIERLVQGVSAANLGKDLKFIALNVSAVYGNMEQMPTLSYNKAEGKLVVQIASLAASNTIASLETSWWMANALKITGMLKVRAIESSVSRLREALGKTRLEVDVDWESFWKMWGSDDIDPHQALSSLQGLGKVFVTSFVSEDWGLDSLYSMGILKRARFTAASTLATEAITSPEAGVVQVSVHLKDSSATPVSQSGPAFWSKVVLTLKAEDALQSAIVNEAEAKLKQQHTSSGFAAPITYVWSTALACRTPDERRTMVDEFRQAISHTLFESSFSLAWLLRTDAATAKRITSLRVEQAVSQVRPVYCRFVDAGCDVKADIATGAVTLHVRLDAKSLADKPHAHSGCGSSLLFILNRNAFDSQEGRLLKELAQSLRNQMCASEQQKVRDYEQRVSDYQNELRRYKDEMSRPCGECKGSGIRKCPVCMGKPSKSGCKSCGSSGSRGQCGSCKGSGQPKVREPKEFRETPPVLLNVDVIDWSARVLEVAKIE